MSLHQWCTKILTKEITTTHTGREIIFLESTIIQRTTWDNTTKIKKKKKKKMKEKKRKAYSTNGDSIWSAALADMQLIIKDI